MVLKSIGRVVKAFIYGFAVVCCYVPMYGDTHGISTCRNLGRVKSTNVLYYIPR